MYDYAIIGAGISGVSFAKMLLLSGNTNFVVLEREPVCGGLCRTIEHSGHVLDVGGGHFLCSKYQEVYDFIFSQIDESAFNQFSRVSKIDVLGSVVDYPLEYNLWQLPDDLKLRLLLSIVEAKRSGCATNYLNWIRDNLGDDIAEVYMYPYNLKLWGIDPSRMDVDWLSKIPAFSLREVLKATFAHAGGNMPSHTKFYYPKRGGFQTIFDAIRRSIGNIVTLYDIKEMRFDNDRWIINDDIQAKTVINTAPWFSLRDALKAPIAVARYINQLRWSSLTVELNKTEYSHDWHWLYIPDEMTPHHREFYIHNFAPHSKQGGIYTECNTDRWKNSGAIYTHHNSYAYPVPIKGHAAVISAILGYYASSRLFGLGRWGQWRYLNADVCILEALRLFKQLK